MIKEEQRMKKLISLLIALSLAVCSLPALADQPELYLAPSDTYAAAYDASAGEAVTMLHPFIDHVDTVETRNLPVYAFKAETDRDITLYYLNGAADVPYLDVRDLKALMNGFVNDIEEASMQYTDESSGPVYMLFRENGSCVMFDFYAQTVTFTDMDAFKQLPEAINPLDCVLLGAGEENGLISHMQLSYSNGDVKTISMGDYGIPMLMHEGAGYIPLQTVADLFIAPYGISMLYNGQCLLFANSALLTTPDIKALYYDAASAKKKSPQLTALTYNELCMALDLYYGLKDEHNIESFDSYFIRTGLFNKLYTDDPQVMADGLADLCIMHFCDGHSGLDFGSYLMEGDIVDIVGDYFVGPQMSRLIEMGRYMTERTKFFDPEKEVPGYEEVGNTAYITFDQFVTDRMKDFYASEQLENTPADTVELLLYAHKQIKRENSPITNVVLDLSYNGGGQVDAAAAVIAWFLGAFDMAFYETATGATAINEYGFDADLDGIVDPQTDSLITGGYNLFCLISPVSFSCGNLVPSAFKQSGKVTLLGRHSAGGACVVLPLTTADGFIFTISGHYRLSTMTNGIYYSVDEGVIPDITITDVSHLYDRQYLTEYLNTLP